ncbi:MAG: hypothetical protein GF329_05935 [Candidatus Lokiarchaeota archaeon]|nr:hypothetical protein [Candidatus Lokiarchaeota archaeon]
MDIDKIYKKLLEKKETNLEGYILKKRVAAFTFAIEKKLDEIEVLSDKIENQKNITFRRKSLEYRLLLYMFQAVFRLNMSQVEIVLNCPNNPELIEFFDLFSNETTISEQEFSDMNKFFEPFREDILRLA